MNDELRAIAGAFDDVLEASLPLERLLEGAAADTPAVPGVRDAVTEMGFQAIALPEDIGGFGGQPDWIAALMQVAGRRLLPPALRDEALLLAPLLATAPGNDRTRDWLNGLPEGTVTGVGAAVVAGPAAGRVTAGGNGFGCDRVPVFAPPEPDVVGVLTEGGGGLFAASDPRVRLEPVEALDPGQGAHHLTVEPGPLPEEVSVGRETAAKLLQKWQLALLAEAVGCADRVTEMAAEYAMERRQFDRPIATFQSVAHILADMKQRTELGRSVLARLVSLMRRDAEHEVADLLAAGRFWVPEAGREVCENGIQVFGGMGFTWELGLHLWYRRVLHIQALLGGSHGAAAAAGVHFTARARAAADEGGPE